MIEKKFLINWILVNILILLLASNYSLSAQNKSTEQIKEEITNNALKGWNNWENRHVFTWVNMPGGLSIKLNFRTRELQKSPYWLTETWVSNKESKTKYVFDNNLTPIAKSYDGSYAEYILEWRGMVANIKSASIDGNLYILFTPVSHSDKTLCTILSVGMMFNKPGKVYKDGKIIKAELPGNKLVEIKSTVRDEDIGFNVMNPHYFYYSDKELGFYTGPDKTHDELMSLINKSKLAYEKRNQEFGEHAQAYNAMKNVTAHNLVYDPMNKRPVISVSRQWNEVWGGFILFDWDTYFAAVMAAVDSKEIAFANALAITNDITERGFIPNVSTVWLKSVDRSQPPVGSICVKLIYQKHPDKQFLMAVYDNLLTWNRWWEKARNNQGFLSWGSDKMPDVVNQNHTKKAAMFESGLDNSPLFDSIDFNPETNMLDLASVGLLSLYVADCQALAFIANELGKNNDVEELQKRGKIFGEKLKEHWDEENGIYRDIYTQTGEFSEHLAPTSFYPLLTNIPTNKQAERLIKEHFFNEEEFFGEWMLPSISRDNPSFFDNVYWRGRIWPPMNFLVYLGLLNYDFPEARKALAEKSANLLIKNWEKHNLVFENYNSVTGVGGDVDRTCPYYSWGGLLGLIALMEAGYWD